MSHDGGILLHLSLIVDILGLQGLAEGYGFGGNHVFERAALYAGEYSRVEQSRHLLDFAFGRLFAPGVVEVFAHEDDTAAGTAQGLVSGRGDDVGILERILEQTGGDEAGGVSHIDHEDGADFVGNLTHAGVVPFARVGRCTADNQFRTLAQSHLFHHIVVDITGIFFHAVFERVEHQAREVHGASVRQVTAVREVQPQELVARVEHGHEYGHVGLGSRVRLHVGPLGVEQLFEPVDSHLLALVYHLATAVITLAGIPFGVFVGQARAHGLHHLFADKVFRGNQFDTFTLSLILFFDNVENDVVSFHVGFVLVYFYHKYPIEMLNSLTARESFTCPTCESSRSILNDWSFEFPMQ